jgi:two-component system, NtrC family, sensor kinase
MRIAIPKICLLVIFMLFSFYSNSQNKTIDSLKKVLATEKKDTNKVNTLNLLSYSYADKKEYANTSQMANEALSLAIKLNFKNGIANAYLNLGLAYDILKNYIIELDYYNKALLIYKEINDIQDIIYTYEYIGIVFTDQNNYAALLKNNYDCQKFRERTKDKNNIADGYYSIGFAYEALKNDSEALKNFIDALKLYKETNNKLHIGICYFNIGDFYFQHENFPEALNRFFAALAIAESEKNFYGIANAYSVIGEVYEKQGELIYRKGGREEAADKFHEAEKNELISLKKYQSLSSEGSISLGFLDLSIVNIKLGNLLKAKKYIDSSLSIAGSIRNKQVLMDDYNNLSTIDSLSKDYKDAYLEYKRSILYRDSLNLEENSKRSVQIQMQYDFDKKESVAKAEQDKKDADTKRRKNQQYFIISGLGVIVLAVVIISLIQFRNNKQKQKANIVLQTTLSNLKSTQSQLIQSEKMASLGELTAGIAHEIQNPLNFVNNFSDVNTELIEELNAERLKPNAERDTELENEILNDIKNNEQKINHHGKRADAIVKGMLQHSRSRTGVKELTDINASADEYLRLSYHGLRAKDKSFNATLNTDFDASIGKINIIPQDIGRVLLNLYNNAFYALAEKSKLPTKDLSGFENLTGLGNFVPTITVVTKKLENQISISVSDNGSGIPQKVIDKIFQPFFTTKPTGQGTGLGLSLSYDIIKAHGGEIKVNTKENEGSEFIILLPV